MSKNRPQSQRIPYDGYSPDADDHREGCGGNDGYGNGKADTDGYGNQPHDAETADKRVHFPNESSGDPVVADPGVRNRKYPRGDKQHRRSIAYV